MENKTDGIKAVNTYYETANAEHDRIHDWFDQIDNKVGFLIAIVIGVPVATIGFASQLEPVDINILAIVLGAIGIVAFLGAGWHIFKVIKAKDLKIGVPYKEFTQYSKDYDDANMREWVADVLIRASEINYAVTLKKAKRLNVIMKFLMCEVVFLLAAITCVLITKL